MPHEDDRQPSCDPHPHEACPSLLVVICPDGLWKGEILKQNVSLWKVTQKRSQVLVTCVLSWPSVVGFWKVSGRVCPKQQVVVGFHVPAGLGGAKPA